MVLELPRNTGSRSFWQQLPFIAPSGHCGCHKEPVLLPKAEAEQEPLLQLRWEQRPQEVSGLSGALTG